MIWVDDVEISGSDEVRVGIGVVVPLGTIGEERRKAADLILAPFDPSSSSTVVYVYSSQIYLQPACLERRDEWRTGSVSSPATF